MTALAKVSVVIPSWNGRAHLEECLPALAAQRSPGVPWEILVLDNGSGDDTAAWLRRHHPRVRLIESASNVGFAAGANRLAAAAAGEAIALLNNDTRPEPGWLGEMVEALGSAPDDVAAVSGLILDWEGERLDFGRGVMTFDGHGFQLDFRRPLAAVRVPADREELPFPCGGNVILRRAALREVAGFDEDYFAYLEDVDLGWRLWAAGKRVVFARRGVVHHRSAATSRLLGVFNRGFLFERNAFLTVFKNYEAGLWERVMPAILVTLLARTSALLAGNPGGEVLAIDPYAAGVAGRGPAGAPVGSSPGQARAPSWGQAAGAGRESLAAAVRERWRRLGPREFLRRGLRRLAGGGTGALRAAAPSAPLLTDPRTVAQLQAVSFLIGNLDRATAGRAMTQARRRRSDQEIFERFPPYLVPTYPGDEGLFAGPGFRSLLPADLPLVEASLAEIMAVGE